MIAKHAIGKDFRGLLSYLLREDMGGREVEAVTLGGNMSGRNARELAHEFAVFRRLNAKVRYPVFHASLRLPTEETLADEQWHVAATAYLTALGYTDTAYVVVKHPENHIHIAAGRVRFDGSTVQTWKDRWRGLQAVEAIEQRFGLAHPPRPTPGTHRRAFCPEPNGDRPAERRTPSPMEVLAERLARAVAETDTGWTSGAEVVSGGDTVRAGLIREARLALAQLQRWNGHLAEETVLGLAALRIGRAHPELAAPTITAALTAADPGALTRFPGGQTALIAQLHGAREARAPEYTGAVVEGQEYGTR